MDDTNVAVETVRTGIAAAVVEVLASWPVGPWVRAMVGVAGGKHEKKRKQRHPRHRVGIKNKLLRSGLGFL